MNILPWEPGHIECKLYMELRYWKHRHQWYRSQAVLLCVGIDPNKIEITSDGNGFTVPDDEFGPHEFDIDWYKTKAERITNLLNQAIEVKEIEILNVPDPEDPEFYINPHVFLQWLTDNKISFPERFNKFFISPQDKAINEAPEDEQQKNKLIVPAQDIATNEAPEDAKQENEYKGQRQIEKAFVKMGLGPGKWRGIYSYLNRRGFPLRHIERGKKPMPVMSEKELMDLKEGKYPVISKK